MKQRAQEDAVGVRLKNVPSIAQQTTRLERQGRWLVRGGWLALCAGLILFSHASSAYWKHWWSAPLALVLTLGPLTATTFYSFLVLDGRAYRLAQTRKERVQVPLPLLPRQR
jgi:hypothetical protein